MLLGRLVHRGCDGCQAGIPGLRQRPLDRHAPPERTVINLRSLSAAPLNGAEPAVCEVAGKDCENRVRALAEVDSTGKSFITTPLRPPFGAGF